MKKILIVFALVLSMIGSGSSAELDLRKHSEDPVILDVSIDGGNLFLYMNLHQEMYVQEVVIYLNKGRKMRLIPITISQGRTVFYLDSKEAYKLKKFGIKSISYNCETGNHRVTLSPEERNKISSSLP